ncbi:uncharacterized protein LOC114802504 isoform X2 [Denticeps clupeoides]|uniref:uncharacterized protein LOC114802462 isoform X1 n=1 Tax=Denticeps clupeoides TaxID=299321 RepID=UPI0010A46B97|nr:uncharacterized protein LOC114802462 isoform X1 [Denticeps clupeoides]XP_028857306.1 uncharacterized protein LOC114802504 isoform X2 [Denticeps clupeoides]
MDRQPGETCNMASSQSDLSDPPGNPQPGDLIEIFRPAYQHWALYLGDGYIINLSPIDEGQAAAMSSVKSVFSRKAVATRAIGAISLVTAAASAFSVLGLINTRSRNRPF